MRSRAKYLYLNFLPAVSALQRIIYPLIKIYQTTEHFSIRAVYILYHSKKMSSEPFGSMTIIKEMR